MSRFHIDPNIARARTISTEVYTSLAIFEEAKEKIFASCWQFAGHTDRVAEPGSLWPFMLLNHYLSEPLLLSRDKNGVLHCLSNVCTHRGSLLAYAPCKASQLRCKYHGRVFDLNGKFQFMPEF
ncbi:MAG: Rieske 2Fe-2S domain-containing protein, partial [Saprospiraceae bacterium]|nr:Rieske 2Fe-2S domain-containing protein [Saprospiraceae bacterium]